MSKGRKPRSATLGFTPRRAVAAFAVVLATLIAASPVWASGVQAEAAARIIHRFGVSAANDIMIGGVDRSNRARATAASVRSDSTLVSCTGSVQCGRGKGSTLSISDIAFSAYQYTAPIVATVKSGDHTLQIRVRSDHGAGGVLNHDGQAVFKLSAEVDIPSNTPPGIYRGTYVMTFEHQ